MGTRALDWFTEKCQNCQWVEIDVDVFDRIRLSKVETLNRMTCWKTADLAAWKPAVVLLLLTSHRSSHFPCSRHDCTLTMPDIVVETIEVGYFPS